MYDGTPITSNEDMPSTTATTKPPADPIPAGGTQAVPTPIDPVTIAPIPGTPQLGAPVDLWDTTWPDTGYYWTVVPVAPASTARGSTVVTPGASQGSKIVPVADSSVFSVGQIVTIGTAPNSDTGTITGVGNGLLTLAADLGTGHSAGDAVTILGGSGGSYKDLILPQDACRSVAEGGLGLVQEFGILSEPTITEAQAPFVTGLSTAGKLVSGDDAHALYGKPLVAWTPALRAQKYQVQWSKSNTPFVATGTVLTTATSLVLPVGVGTWYYRVRGFDYSLPTDAQQMSWSPVASVTVKPPTFAIDTSSKGTFTIQGGTKKTKKAKAKAKKPAAKAKKKSAASKP
jgi:hypothetical protein